MYVIKLIQDSIYRLEYHQRRPKRFGAKLLCIWSFSRSHPWGIAGVWPCWSLPWALLRWSFCLGTCTAFPRRMSCPNANERMAWASPALCPALGPTLLGLAFPVQLAQCTHMGRTEEHRAWLVTEQEVLTSPWGADRGFQCQVKQSSWTVLTSDRSYQGHGALNYLCQEETPDSWEPRIFSRAACHKDFYQK